VDLSHEILELAQRGVYSLTAPPLVGSALFDRITEAEMHAMFEPGSNPDEVRIRSWLREGIAWHRGDAASPELRDVLGPQDIVVANNFLCHMDPPDADRCLRNIARLVVPGGYLVVSGIDLDVRTTVALDLGLTPVRDLMEDIHDGDPSLRNDWPWTYWGLEPFNRRRHDWRIRYAAVFQVGESVVGRFDRMASAPPTSDHACCG
jgi:SAM-dependent methyltransferase